MFHEQPKARVQPLIKWTRWIASYNVVHGSRIVDDTAQSFQTSLYAIWVRRENIQVCFVPKVYDLTKTVEKPLPLHQRDTGTWLFRLFMIFAGLFQIAIERHVATPGYIDHVAAMFVDQAIVRLSLRMSHMQALWICVKVLQMRQHSVDELRKPALVRSQPKYGQRTGTAARRPGLDLTSFAKSNDGGV